MPALKPEVAKRMRALPMRARTGSARTHYVSTYEQDKWVYVPARAETVRANEGCT